MQTPLERATGRTIGVVESVGPTEFRVQLEIEAPRATALSDGRPIPFPRINSYLAIPGQAGAVVGQVAWLGIERSQFPKRKGLKDFDLVDLPFPMRRLVLIPIGTLRQASETDLRLERGIDVFPSVGDPVVLLDDAEMAAVLEADPGFGRVSIGRASGGPYGEVCIDPDKAFGRHLAVLGNTGSGKSCSVAGLIRWTLEAARKKFGEPSHESGRRTRFIVLDPNGEYAKAFEDDGVRAKVVKPGDESSPLSVPAWTWTAAEFAAVLSASPGVQAPVLRDALRRIRTGTPGSDARTEVGCRDVLNCVDVIEAMSHDLTLTGTLPHMGKVKKALDAIQEACDWVCEDDELEADLHEALGELKTSASDARSQYSGDYDGQLTRAHVDDLLQKAAAVKERSPLGGLSERASADSPIRFDVRTLPAAIRVSAILSPDANALNYIAPMLTRLEGLLADPRLSPVITGEDVPDLETWLSTILGTGGDDSTEVVIVDLSLLATDVVHLLIAIMARIIFESLQRHRSETGHHLPTVMVLEEAHTFVQAGRDDPNEVPSPIQLCRRIFERVAREGRKFGLGLVLSSQRPSEISQTVLSQCNTFLLHRLVNDHDQQLVRRLVPDTLSELLRELSVLPSRHAVLLGYASPIPRLVIMHNLPESHRPRSSDPDVWDSLDPTRAPSAVWEQVAASWTQPPTLQADGARNDDESNDEDE